MNNTFRWTLVMAFVPLAFSAFAQNISMAKDFYSHNLIDRALEEFILVYNTDEANPKDRSEALYYMGQISFDKGLYSQAFDDWSALVKAFPSSNRAIEIKDRIIELAEVFTNSIDENTYSSIAKSYIKNGDFWSGSKRKFTIDDSWLPSVELAISWYDRVIAEFPNTKAAEIAYKRKLFTIIGWKEPGQYGKSYGIEKNYKKYLPLLISTFMEFERSFPKNSSLQAFRYQIAQIYWYRKDWVNTRIWLNKIVETSNGKTSFYTEAAKARLSKLEY